MNNINKIYDNEIGISFTWNNTNTNLIQIIFRDTGFHLSLNEIEIFVEKIIASKEQKNCPTCSLGDNCRSILLQTPSNKISLAISKIELDQIEDLLRGTLFQLKMKNYINDLCKN